MPRWVSKITAPGSRDGSAITSTFAAERCFGAELSVTSAACDGMDADAGDLLPLQLFERRQHQAVQRLGIDGEFAAEHAAGDGERQLAPGRPRPRRAGGRAGRRSPRWIAPGGRSPAAVRRPRAGGRPLRPRAVRRRALRATRCFQFAAGAATARGAARQAGGFVGSTPVRAGPAASHLAPDQRARPPDVVRQAAP